MSDPQGVIPVAVQGFTWSAAAGWSTFVVITGAIGVVLRAVGPARLYEIWVNRDKSLRDERRSDEVSSEARIDALELRSATAERRLTHVLSACTILIAALEQTSPDNPALHQARSQLQMAASAMTDPFIDMITKLGGVHRGPDGKPVVEP